MRGERPTPSSLHISPPRETGRSGCPLEEHKHRRLGKFSLDIPVLLKSRSTGKTGPIKTCGDRRRAKQIETEFGEGDCCRVEGKGERRRRRPSFQLHSVMINTPCWQNAQLLERLEQIVAKSSEGQTDINQLLSFEFAISKRVHAAHVGSCVTERIHTVATGCGGEPRDGGGTGM